MRLALNAAVVLVSVLMFGLGVQWLMTPQPTAASFGIALDGALAYSTARGDVAGMFLAGGTMGLLGLLLRNTAWLYALALLLLLIAAGRAVSFVLDGLAVQALVNFVAELLMATALIARARFKTPEAAAAPAAITALDTPPATPTRTD